MIRHILAETFIIFVKMNEKDQLLKEAVRLLIDAGANCTEAEQYVSDMAVAVPEFACRHIPGILRWTTGGDINVECEEELNQLNLFLRFIKNAEVGEFYDDDFNGLSFAEIVTLFKLNLDAGEYSIPESAEYSVVKIKSYNELQTYREWTKDWCITVSEIAFVGYSLDGENDIWILLRDDFRKVPKKPSDGFPNDSYGNSILCVITKPDGSIDSVTNRWNAIGKENDNPETFLEDIVGPNYKERIKV